MQAKEATMARKAPQQTNILIHLLIWTLGTPALFVAMSAGIFAMLKAPSGQTTTVAVLAAIAGLFVGLPLGFISFFVARGSRSWGQFFAERRAQKRYLAALQAQAMEAAWFANQRPADPVHMEVVDPWEGTNPYGCCRGNYDTEGRLVHGGPGCLHPLILEQRQGY